MENEAVDLTALSYEWDCPRCDEINEEPCIPVTGTALGEVKCFNCKVVFDVGHYHHDFG